MELTSWPKLHTLAVILDLKEAYLLPQKVKRKINTRKRQGDVYPSCHNDFIFFQISPKTRAWRLKKERFILDL